MDCYGLTGSVHVRALDAATAPVIDLVRQTGLVFQNPDTMLFADSVRQIMFGLENIGSDSPERVISDVLTMVGLSGSESTYPRHLSRANGSVLRSPVFLP